MKFFSSICLCAVCLSQQTLDSHAFDTSCNFVTILYTGRHNKRGKYAKMTPKIIDFGAQHGMYSWACRYGMKWELNFVIVTVPCLWLAGAVHGVLAYISATNFCCCTLTGQTTVPHGQDVTPMRFYRQRCSQQLRSCTLQKQTSFFCTVRWSSLSRAVLTNGHTGHVPRAPGFFLFEGPQLAVVK